jgi:hypothetical protein
MKTSCKSFIKPYMLKHSIFTPIATSITFTTYYYCNQPLIIHQLKCPFAVAHTGIGVFADNVLYIQHISCG